MALFKKILKWALIVIVAAYIVMVIVRAFQIGEEERTAEEVAKIHATKLTLDDVMGKNLPPDPGEAADDTVAGIDANTNGIRDDVELAIFKEYPNSAKTRAVLLQYALALQMEVTQSIVNTETVIAVAQEQGRASMCVGKVFPRDDIQLYFNKTQELKNSIELKQINNQTRKAYREDFYNKLGSFSSLEGQCDLDLATLSEK